jgi:hypothetical protein
VPTPSFSPLRAARRLALAALAIGLALRAPGAQASPVVAPTADHVLRVAPVRGAAPVIDGRLDDPAWRAAPVATDFTQRSPRAGAPSRFRTEVRVLLDGGALYVGVHAFDPAPDSIGRQLARRDAEDIYSDWINVGIDSFRDRRTAFVFALNPRGVQRDVYLFDDTEDDILWDAVWTSAASIVADGWIAEFRIPLSQLRYSRTATTGAGDLPPGSWGFNVSREVAREAEESFWRPTPPDQPGIVSRFGTLTGLEGLGRANALELIPYVRAQGTTIPSAEVTPLVGANSGEAAVGLDVRYRLPRNLTLSATVNPDFGQVEADPAVVNLTQFEVFFPERRPFFLEGADAFAFGRTRTLNDDDPPTFFYTRRIGRSPVRGAGGAGIVATDAPRQTAILGAAKVSGKTPGGWSVGALLAATRAEDARRLDTTGTTSRLVVEPPGGYGILRLRKDARGGNTVVGGIATVATRDAGGAFAALLPSRSVVTGIDFEHAWAARTWAVSGVLARSAVSGDAAHVTRLQRAPYRLYQRPDATHLDVDATRTTLGGHFGAFSVAKTGGDLVGSATYEETSPGFETNDVGFQQRTDIRALSTALQYRSLVQGTSGLARRFREWEVGSFVTTTRNFAGDMLALRTAASASATFENLWSVELFVTRSAPAWNDRLTRGGPLARLPARWRSTFELESDTRRAIIGRVTLGAEGDSAGRRGRELRLALDLRPTSALRVRIGPEYVDRTDPDQWLANVADPLATATFGTRHVFGVIDRRELNLTTRIDWTFSPTLSLQVFAQPFAAAGHVRTFRTFDRPRAFAFTDLPAERGGGTVRLDPDGTGPAAPFTIGEPDFRVRSLRGNAVVRWEFRPGSALFLVWQQQRSVERDPSLGPLAGPAIDGDAFRTVADPGTHVFLAKVTWWIGR